MWNFPEVNPKQSFPNIEEEILKFWKENNIFEKSLENRKWAEEFKFYDWPPFATGLPHYWHMLQWVVKDIIPRYQTMKWKYVPRNFGWDCHGLPIEWIVEEKLWVKNKKEIEEKIWVYEFNEECRKNVFLYADERRKFVERIWRWVDMDNDYKTLNKDFMESVWWVFKTLYDKWLIYEWYRVVPYSVWMGTPLSNFEVNQWYAEKQDKAITVKFQSNDEENTYFLAWTTTPWTIVSNLALAVGENIEYVKLKDKSTNENYILAKYTISNYYKSEEEYEIVEEFKWKDLIWISYKPVFYDFWEQKENLASWAYLTENSYKVVAWHHVSVESWTWIVHIAPSYWEDDYQIWKQQNIWFVYHIDDEWYTQNLLEDNNMWVFDYNEHAYQKLKKEWKIVKVETIVHNYPFCWRTDVPLIYKAISAWYVSVSEFKDRLLKNNEKINWIPEHLKHWRFGKWLENAQDWNISRNRFWWVALPVWQDEEKEETIVIWSIQELYELNKDFWQIEYKDWNYYYAKTWDEIDLHKHFVDDIYLKSPNTWKTLYRIPEVLDCWFESGSMPYASIHYPFENKDNFRFPADFIAEWIDQTRWWFYTLLVLSTALFDNAPFLNVITTGTILAQDGKKMSKRLQNYPEPSRMLNEYWADAMRFYMINSPVVEAQSLNFAEKWVDDVVKNLLLPIWNTYYFFTTYANIDNFSPSNDFQVENPLDKWVIWEFYQMLEKVEEWFNENKTLNSTKPILDFIDDLTNWYIRRSRRRFWKSENDNDKIQAYNTLYFILTEFMKVLAPFCPFISEKIYKQLTWKESVHLEYYPKVQNNMIDQKLIDDMRKVKNIVWLGLSLRSKNNIRVRQPLSSISIWENLDEYYIQIIKEELNVKNVEILDDMGTIATKVCKPNAKLLWPKYWKAVQEIIKNAKEGNFQELDDGKVQVLDFVLEPEEFEIVYDKKEWWLDVHGDKGVVVWMDLNITQDLQQEWYVRDIIRIVQEARKEADYNVDDRIKLQLVIENWELEIENFKDYIQNETLSHILPELDDFDIEKEFEIDWFQGRVRLKR